MDLIKLITDKVKEVESSGKLEEIIEKHVLQCLDDVVKDSFRWNGEAKKSIELALKDKLNINPANLRLARYQKIVTGIVEDRLNTTVVENLTLEIQKAVDDVTEVIEKKEWNLSEIISKFIYSLDTSYDGDMEDQYGECTLIVNSDGDFCHIYFDKEENKEKYQCENQIALHHNKIFHVKLDDKIFSPFAIYSMDSYESFLFKLYCNNVSIVLDEEKCDLNYYREDCN